MMIELINALPIGLTITILSFIFIFNYYSFTKSSSIEKTLENKKLRLLRKFHDDFILFIVFMLCSLVFKSNSELKIDVFFAVMMNYVISLVLLTISTISNTKLNTFLTHIKYAKLRGFAYVLSLILVLIMYVDAIQYYVYTIESKLQITSPDILNAILTASSKDIQMLPAFIFGSLLNFCLFRFLLLPSGQLLLRKESVYRNVDVILKEGNPIINVFLVESFDNNYVFYDEVNEDLPIGKFVISKENINYLKFNK